MLRGVLDRVSLDGYTSGCHKEQDMRQQPALSPVALSLRVASTVAYSLLLASCLGLGTQQHTPAPSPTPTATPLVMLEIVTPTPGPAVRPEATSTASSDGSAITQAPQGGDARPETYVVQPGDTLYAIAAKFKVDLQALVEANKITDPDSLQVGQVLVIPTPQAP